MISFFGCKLQIQHMRFGMFVTFGNSQYILFMSTKVHVKVLNYWVLLHFLGLLLG